MRTGVALGLSVIHVRPQFALDLDPLEESPVARLEAIRLEELREKARWLLAHRDEFITQHREQWKVLVLDTYGPVTEEEARAFVD